MYRELGLLCILFLPVLLIYFSRQNINDQQTKSKKSKKKKNKKKSNTKINPIIEDQTKNKNLRLEINNTVSTNQPQLSNETENLSQQKPNTTNEKKQQNEPNTKIITEKKQNKNTTTTTTTTTTTNNNNRNKSNKSNGNKLPKSEFPPLSSPQQQQNKEREIDEHMDLTPRYSRVMRIKSEEPAEILPPVPKQDGWTSVNEKSSSYNGSSTITKDEPLTKKQRENKARAEKKKQAKAAANAIQEQRLKQHQRQLEKERIAEFYSKGPGKNTPWSTNKSSKTPTAKAGLNEYGQLIWD
ncbi:unnamed protein product [Cunninghamella blakesleeana]